MATSLGLVGIVNKGNYSASATYVKGNFVYHNHSTWLCIVPSASGIEPSLQTSTTWQPLALGVNLEAFTGATASTDGTMGAVPQPHAGDEGKVLYGNGKWGNAAADDNFVGTLARWNALTLAEQIKYKTADITDDFNGSPIDSALSDTSTNPVQNRVITEEFGNIGTVLYKRTAIFTVPANTITATHSVELTKGTWLLIGAANWQANTNGYRQIQFTDVNADPPRDTAVSSIPPSLNTKQHYMQVIKIQKVESTTTITLYALQTSGGDLNVYPYIGAIRIR